ncbi:MAG: hypothetical protein ACREX9_17950, partial [Gammaproteobacteria bacterium]
VTGGNRIVRETGHSERHVSMTEYRRAQVPRATGFLTVNRRIWGYRGTGNWYCALYGYSY